MFPKHGVREKFLLERDGSSRHLSVFEPGLMPADLILQHRSVLAALRAPKVSWKNFSFFFTRF